MNVGAYLTGPFGQSQGLYRVRNEAKRGRGSIVDVDAQILKDTKAVIELQKDADLSFIVDPMFKFFYLFQPFAEKVNGVSVGPQENWFNNNVFFWRPQISRPLNSEATGFTSDYIHLDLLPADGTAMAILPSPYTLMMLSDVKGYQSQKSAVVDLAQLMKEEAQDLVSKGIARIQYDEPVIVYKQSLGSLEDSDIKLLELAMQHCGQVDGATTSLHTYFGDAGPLIPSLIDLPVDGIGIDATETSLDDVMKYTFKEKELALGLVDGRNTSLEDPDELVQTLRKLADSTQPTALWLTPNTATEYRGWTHAHSKLAILREVMKRFNDD